MDFRLYDMWQELSIVIVGSLRVEGFVGRTQNLVTTSTVE